MPEPETLSQLMMLIDIGQNCFVECANDLFDAIAQDVAQCVMQTELCPLIFRDSELSQSSADLGPLLHLQEAP